MIINLKRLKERNERKNLKFMEFGMTKTLVMRDLHLDRKRKRIILRQV